MAWFTFNQKALTAYKPVQQDECSSSPTTQKPPNHKRHIFVFILVLLLGVILLAIYAAGLSFGPVTQPFVAIPEKSCGSNSQQASDRGCHFDLMSFSWLPDECYDKELIQEFDSLQDWHWFGNPEGTHQISRSQVLLGEVDALFVSFEYHRAHCVFMWKKLHRALERGGFVDSYISNYNHTSHCGHMLLMEVEDSLALNTQILRKFPTCRPSSSNL